MTIFRTDRPKNAAYIFKNWLITVATISLLVIFALLLPGKLFTVKASSFFILGVLLLSSLVEKIDKDRLYEIHFDNSKQQITFFYKSLFSGSHQKILSFYGASLEVGRVSLSFWSGKTEFFRIDKNKDGFSVDTLHKIRQTVENISLPVTGMPDVD